MTRENPPPGPSVSIAEMETRVARFKELKGSDLCFMDQRIPGHEREMINLLGLGVTENEDDPDLAPKIGPAHVFYAGPTEFLDRYYSAGCVRPSDALAPFITGDRSGVPSG